MRVKKCHKTKLVISALAAVALTATLSQAQTLTFEGLQDSEPINNYYNGGLGGLGSGPGPNYGIAFSSDSLAIIASAAGGTGNFTDAPSGETVAFFLNGPGDVMDVAAGFNTGFSFFYSSASQAVTGGPGSVTVWSGLDGSGTELASLTLLDTDNNGDPNGSFYNMWDPTGVSFTGSAESAIFAGAAGFIAFDNITLGSSKPGLGNGNAVPDNGGLSIELLAGLTLASAVFAAKKNAVSCS